MRAPHLITLGLLAAIATPSLAQETTSDADVVAEEMAEKEMANEVMADDAMAEDAMAEDAMAEDAADMEMADGTTADAMSDEVATDETPSLEEIAASDPALDVRTNEEGEVDAMVMLSDVLFAFGDASLRPAALEVLAGVAAKLDGVESLAITGHTDAVGDADFNLALGQRRADTVRDWLIANTALTAEVVTATSAGEDDPIAANDTSQNRALNRRVEFTLPGEE